ncbi:hypothetical protein G5V59_12755 [Nocardioides sp. W3-2-3]|uniref:hypothetical protein n=1 Tax=Nocardioides convexus TaxID=2712224 RepID=UPI0024187753|nr:hypothetical protein [Nocardioides convexus]NHA00594.1 hypothetical protein [Nocardioides convexus]
MAQRQMRDLRADGLAETLRLAAAVADAHLRCGSLGTAERVCREALSAYASAPSELDRAASYWRASTAEAAVGGATPAAVQAGVDGAGARRDRRRQRSRRADCSPARPPTRTPHR